MESGGLLEYQSMPWPQRHERSIYQNVLALFDWLDSEEFSKLNISNEDQ